MPPTDHASDVRCARCGYHLRGEIGRWTASCPLTGTCNECGLAFDWKDVFSNARHPWLFEASWRLRPSHRIGATVLNACSPPRFWRSVRMSDRIVLGPTIALVFGVFAVLYAALLVWVLYEWRVPQNAATVFDWIRAAGRSVPAVNAWILEQLTAPIVMAIVLPLAFLSIPETLGKARVRAAHITRIWLYSLLLPLLLAAGWAVIQAGARVFGRPELGHMLNPSYWSVPVDGTEPSLVLVLAFVWGTVLSVALLTGWFWWWWSCAFGKYLRFAHTRRVIITMLTIAALAALCTM